MKAGPLAGALAALSLSLSSAGLAQAPVQRPTPLPALGRGIVGTDDTTALLQNPANLAFMTGAELRWTGIFLDERVGVPWQGHAFALGVALPFGIATGLRLDLVNPPAAALGAFTPFASSNYQWLTWGLAFGGDTTALGFSLQRSYSDSPDADGLGSYSIGLTTRPFDPVGLSLVAHDLNGPTNEAGGRLGPSYDVALALRPIGTRVVELGLEGKYLADPDFWIPRATLGIDIAPVGRLLGEFSVSDPGNESRRAWLASASLAIATNAPSGSVELAAGGVTGDGLGADGSYGFHSDVAFRGWREPVGPEAPRWAARIRIEDTPSPRGHVALLRELWELADEPAVDAVVFEIRTQPADSLAHVQELRDAVGLLRSHGKRVLCHLEDATGSALYLCSAASRILINPAGGLRFAGMKNQHLYFKGLLSKLGIRADFIRIGAHKTAPEQLTREGATDVARSDYIDMLQQNERQLVEGIAAGRRIPPAELRRRIASGPFIASEAKEKGLVDGYAFDDQLEDEVSQLAGRRLPLLDDERVERKRERFGSQPGLAIVYVDGDMVDGRSKSIPFVGMKLAGSYTIAEALKDARENPRIRAVVLRVESPGGSAMAADVIWRAVQLTAQRKPVIVSMGSYAASGGYYVAAPGTRIFANPLSITGSIGIFYGKADVAELLGKIGVNVEIYKTAPRADAESIFRPFTDGERKELGRKVAQFYEVFLSRVAEGRKLGRDEVDAVGQGRVWTGEQARARKLVDELGGLRQALDYARKLVNLRTDAPITELPRPDTTLLGKLLGIEGLHAEAALSVQSALPPELVRMVHALGPFVVYPGDVPMARLELTPVEP